MKSMIIFLLLLMLVGLVSCYPTYKDYPTAKTSISKETANVLNRDIRKEYLNESLRIVKKAKKAKYYFYTEYYHGNAYSGTPYPISICFGKEYISLSDSLTVDNNLILLNDTLTVYNRRGDFISTKYIFSQGFLVKQISYYRDYNVMGAVRDWSDKYKGYHYSFSVKMYSLSGEITSFKYIILDKSQRVGVNIEI